MVHTGTFPEFKVGNAISLAWSQSIFWKTKLEVGMPNMSVKQLLLIWIKPPVEEMSLLLRPRTDVQRGFGNNGV